MHEGYVWTPWPYVRPVPHQIGTCGFDLDVITPSSVTDTYLGQLCGLGPHAY